MWPWLPLVVEGLVYPALASTGAACFALWFIGRSSLLGLGCLPLFGAYCRVKRVVLGPQVAPAGRCSREDHRKRVEAASAAAKAGTGQLRMYKATASNTFRPHQIRAREQSQARLDLSGFVHVLEVNTEELWCDIEASATFETFVAEALVVGVAPLVIPELRTITVGGAIVGIGVESSSFRHGFFHEGLLEADILLASGEVVTISSQGEYAELFHGVPNSLGAFGYLLRLRMRVQRAQPFVSLCKTWFPSPEELIAGLELACSGKEHADFVDAVALSDQGGMVLCAKFVSELPKGATLRQYGVWPQFYSSIVVEGTEYLSISDYLWRWDADWFWCTQIFPGLSWPVVRHLCGPEMLRSDAYKVFNDFVIKTVLEPLGLNKNEELIIQDIEIPSHKAAHWIRSFLVAVPSKRIGKIKLKRRETKEVSVPIWLCPVKGTSSTLMPMDANKLYINFGFWDSLTGKETMGGMAAGNINRALEQLCKNFEGKKTLYSAAYFTEEEFHNEYNGEAYDRLKKRYDPSGRLRSRYERLTRP